MNPLCAYAMPSWIYYLFAHLLREQEQEEPCDAIDQTGAVGHDEYISCSDGDNEIHGRMDGHLNNPFTFPFLVHL